MPCVFDLTDCSIVVPVHIDSKERLEHMHSVRAYFDRYFRGHELIVEQEDGAFSTAKVSNQGASRVKTPFFCKYDVDAFIHPKALFEGFQKLKNGASCVLPYNGISWTIQNPLRKKLLKSLDVEELPHGENTDLILKNGESTGLIHQFRTAFFKELGGYNEEFIGWGYEDDEILYRFRKFTNVEYLEGYNAFHFDHPRIPGDPAQALKNQFLSLVVKNMDPEDLRAYIDTWSRFKNERSCTR